MEEKNKPLKIDEIIGLLDAANKTLESKVKLPSLEEEIAVSTMNTFHTKNIIKSAASGLFYDYQFILVIYNILKEIVKTPLDKLSIADKSILLLHLRSKNISDIVSLTVNGMKKGEDDKLVSDSFDYKINISKHLSKLNFGKNDFDEEEVETPEYTATLRFPTIKEEYEFTEHLYKNKLSSVDEENKATIKGLIAPIFIYSIAPYIKKLTVGDKVIPVESKKIDERLAIVEKLSAKMNHKIMLKIEDTYAKVLSKIVDIEVEKDEVKYNGSIKLDAELFIDKTV